jgi:hypothetical protein
VAVLHKIALSLSLYWSINWFDIPMHFFGGALIALITLFFIYDEKFFNFPDKKPVTIFWAALSMTIIVGLGWELWEIFMGFTDVKLDLIDTIADLINDTLGAITAYFYSKNKICQKEN